MFRATSHDALGVFQRFGKAKLEPFSDIEMIEHCCHVSTKRCESKWPGGARARPKPRRRSADARAEMRRMRRHT